MSTFRFEGHVPPLTDFDEARAWIRQEKIATLIGPVADLNAGNAEQEIYRLALLWLASCRPGDVLRVLAKSLKPEILDNPHLLDRLNEGVPSSLDESSSLAKALLNLIDLEKEDHPNAWCFQAAYARLAPLLNQYVDKKFLVYSRNEEMFDGAGFWDNQNGWVTQDEASAFDLEERLILLLPMSRDNDAKWVCAQEPKLTPPEGSDDEDEEEDSRPAMGL